MVCDQHKINQLKLRHKQWLATKAVPICLAETKQQKAINSKGKATAKAIATIATKTASAIKTASDSFR